MMKDVEHGVAFVLLPRPDTVPTGIGVIRSLGRRGIAVIAASSERAPLSSTSRYVREYLRLPDPADDCPAFVDALVEAGMAHSPRPVLFVSSDYDALLVNSYRERIEAAFRYPFISREALACCLEKDRTIALAQAAGVGYPATWRVDPDADIESVCASVAYPCVIKPSSWAEFDGVKIREKSAFRKVFRSKAVRARTEAELAAVLSQTREMGFPIVVQEEITGPSDQILAASVCTDEHGAIRAIYTCRKTRQYPSDFGTGTMIEGVPLPEVADLCERLCREARFHGVAELEFKRDVRDGELKIIEINPRPGTWISAAPASGVDTPYIAYRDLAGLPVAQQRQRDELVRWCEAWPDLEYFIKNRKGDHTGARLSLRDYLASRRGRCAWAYWAPDDPRPSVRRLGHEVADLLSRAFRRAMRGIRRTPPGSGVAQDQARAAVAGRPTA
ncbi:MAG: ATP-grasp domain-containing protein [Armatimonadota bacterium]|jgi:D-aspartate ligase